MMLVRKGKLILFEFIIFITKDCIMSAMLLHSNASPHHVGQAHRRIEIRDSHKKIQLVLPFVGGLSGLGRSHEVWQRILEARTRIMGPSTRPSSSGVKNSPCRSTSTHHLLFPLAIPHCRSLSFNSLNVGCALFHSIIFFVSAGSSTWISSMIDRTSDFSNHRHQQIAHPNVLSHPCTCDKISGHQIFQQGYNTLTSAIITRQMSPTIIINTLQRLMLYATLKALLRFLGIEFPNKDTLIPTITAPPTLDPSSPNVHSYALSL